MIQGRRLKDTLEGSYAYFPSGFRLLDLMPDSSIMTYFRISTDDRRGKIKAYLGEGEFTDDPFDMDGGIAVCKVPRLRQLLAHLCREGFEHHVAMARTHFAEALQEATQKYMGWDLYHHE